MMLVAPVMAENHPPRLVDDADLLTAEEEANVEAMLDEISERQQFDVAVVTTDSLDGKSAQDFADDYYDYNGYGMGENYDGAMLVVSMSEREWHITTCGYGMVAIPEYEIDSIADQFVSYLSYGEYEAAFLTFAECCDEYVSYANEEDIVYDPSDYEASMEVDTRGNIRQTLATLFGALVAGFLLAFLPMSVMKKEMKTVNWKAEARDYMVPGSRHLSVNRDRFLYHTVNRTPKPKDTSHHSGGGGGHISSSGRSHGGGGGRF